MKLRRLGVLLGWLALFCAAGPTAQSQETRIHGSRTCRVEQPRAWNGGRVSWLGGCAAGYAHGLGALRQEVDGIPPNVFLGRVESGMLRTGVLVSEGGMAPVRWRSSVIAGGAGQNESGRNTLLQAFRVAALAADHARSRALRASDGSTASYYTQLAGRLRNQMD